VFFWAIRQGTVVIPYRRFGTTYRSHLLGSRDLVLDAWPLKMGTIVCPETSVRNYHCSLRNSPEDSNSYLLCGGSLSQARATYVVWRVHVSSHTAIRRTYAIRHTLHISAFYCGFQDIKIYHVLLAYFTLIPPWR